MAGKYDRQRFLARLLLLSAAQSDGSQGSTSFCACHTANMTFGKTDREKRCKTHTPYVVDCAFAAQSGGGWWLAGEGARCLSVRGTRTLFRDRAGRGSNPCPGFLPGRTRVTCSRVSHLRDFALLGSVSVTVVRWCLLFPPARASSSRQLCLGLATYGPVLRVSSIAH